jgi:hypothetical protein
MCDTMRRLLLLFVGSMMVQLAEPRRHKHTNQPTELADPAIVVEGNHTLALFPTPCLPTLRTVPAAVGNRTYCFNPMRCKNGVEGGGTEDGGGSPHPRGVGDDSKLSATAAAVDCARPMMTFVWHSGYGNQLQAFRHALLMAVYLNRTLLVPPVLPHYTLTGNCGAEGALKQLPTVGSILTLI